MKTFLTSLVDTSIILASALIVGACGHLHRVDGPVEKSEIPAGTMVRIGSKEVAEGDKIILKKSVCRKVARARAGSINECRYENAGEALVIKVLDHDSSIVQPDEGFKIDNSMRAEKK